MEFRKGRKKTGGRKPGTPNKATESIKNLLNRLVPEERLEREWNYHLKHADPHIRFEAFKLANSYLFGKPVQPVLGEELAPPIHIDISAIPRKRKRVMERIPQGIAPKE
jgi:hypothetical protein